MNSKILLAIALTLALLGCGDDPQPPAGPPAKPAKPKPLKFGPAVRPKSTSADIAEVAHNGNRFALELYAQLAAEKQGQNLFCSPFGISSTLAMGVAGARDNTAAEMKIALHFTLEDENTHAATGALIHDLQAAQDKRGYQLSVANALWADKSHKFLPAFLALNKKCYGAGARLVDFRKNAEGTRKTINSWVARHTADKIQGLLGPGMLDARTRLVLTNAVYFKGDWVSRFSTDETKNRPFYLTDKKFFYVTTMHQTDRFAYFRGRTFRLLEMPYRGNRLSMLILLPERTDGLAALEESLTAKKLKEWMDLAYRRDVEVYLPRFKLTCQFRLEKTLAALGIADAFTPKADFSGIDGVPASDPESLFITAVAHKAFVDLNEKGTEAAAATDVAGASKSTSEPPPPAVFRADHPFLFMIRDRETGTILFIGRIINPKGLSPAVRATEM